MARLQRPMPVAQLDLPNVVRKAEISNVGCSTVQMALRQGNLVELPQSTRTKVAITGQKASASQSPVADSSGDVPIAA
jgi:hypothetical protein